SYCAIVEVTLTVHCHLQTVSQQRERSARKARGTMSQYRTTHRRETAASSARPGRAHPLAAATEHCLLPGADHDRVVRGRALLLDEDTYFSLAETFRALADSTRAKIIYSLLRQELCTCDLAAITGSSESSVSQHLRVLRQLRLVKSQRRGKQVFYSLDDTHIRILLAVCLSHVQDADRQHAGLDKVLALFEEAEKPSGSAVAGSGRDR